MKDFKAWTILLLVLLYSLLVISVLLVLSYAFQLVIKQMMYQQKDNNKNQKSHLRTTLL